MVAGWRSREFKFNRAPVNTFNRATAQELHESMR
jgi:hypothetical protein